MVLKWKQITTTLNAWICQKTIQRVICKILSTLQKKSCFVRTQALFKPVHLTNTTLPKDLWKWFHQGVCSVVTRMMPHTATNSTKSKDLWLAKIFQWVTLKERLRWLSRKCLVKTVKSAFVHLTSHSRSHLLKWTCHASNVVVKAVTFVRKQVGLKFLGQEWFTLAS